jgi:hypothetical protein
LHGSYLVKRAVELTMDLAYTSQTIDEFAAQYYDKMLDWTWPQLEAPTSSLWPNAWSRP